MPRINCTFFKISVMATVIRYACQSSWNSIAFFLCISSLIVETKIYKYLRFGLTLIDTCSADITYFVILWKILSMYSILHMCCRNIVVNMQQLLRNSLGFPPCTNLSCTYIKKLISVIWGCNFVLEYFKKIIYLIEISFFLSKEA